MKTTARRTFSLPIDLIVLSLRAGFIAGIAGWGQTPGIALAAAGAEDGVDALRQASFVASAALTEINAVRSGPSRLEDGGSGGSHASLNQEVNALETAANKLKQASGGDAAALQQAMASFTSALQISIALAAEISSRDTENDAAKDMAVQIASALGQYKTQLPRPK